MRKTQGSSRKTSFKGILNLQNEKLPQKKSRSRSIRDRNTTTNQYTYSRATQINNKSFNDKGQNDNTNRKLRQDNKDFINGSRVNENLNRNESSIEKVRQNLRKQSQQIKQRQRNRSNSRRKRSQNRNKQNSILHHANRFPNTIPINTSPSSQNAFITNPNEKHLLTQINSLKSHLNTIEKSYSAIEGQLGSISSSDLNSSKMSMLNNEQQQLKQKANDLNNILESFHIRLKENFNKITKQLLSKIDQYQEISTVNKENVVDNYNSNDKQNHNDENLSSIQINSVFITIEKQFGIGQYSSQNNSLFSRMRNSITNNFNDLQKKLAVTQERLLK